ncbi:hypothetical protein BHM03_00005635 [Ensete ventricosum]|nr:hypothetical protein BHM03_00005635 [Ensete ventricosum]
MKPSCTSYAPPSTSSAGVAMHPPPTAAAGAVVEAPGFPHPYYLHPHPHPHPHPHSHHHQPHPAPPPAPPVVYSKPEQQRIKTLFVSGLPDDVKPREIHNLFRRRPGFDSCQLEYTGRGDQVAAFAPLFVWGFDASRFLVFDLRKLLFIESNMVKFVWLNSEYSGFHMLKMRGRGGMPVAFADFTICEVENEKKLVLPLKSRRLPSPQ